MPERQLYDDNGNPIAPRPAGRTLYDDNGRPIAPVGGRPLQKLVDDGQPAPGVMPRLMGWTRPDVSEAEYTKPAQPPGVAERVAGELEPLAHPKTGNDFINLALMGTPVGEAVNDKILGPVLRTAGRGVSKLAEYGEPLTDAAVTFGKTIAHQYLPAPVVTTAGEAARLVGRGVFKTLGAIKDFNSPLTVEGRAARAYANKTAETQAFNALPIIQQMPDLPLDTPPPVGRVTPPSQRYSRETPYHEKPVWQQMAEDDAAAARAEAAAAAPPSSDLDAYGVRHGDPTGYRPPPKPPPKPGQEPRLRKDSAGETSPDLHDSLITAVVEAADQDPARVSSLPPPIETVGEGWTVNKNGERVYSSGNPSTSAVQAATETPGSMPRSREGISPPDDITDPGYAASMDQPRVPTPAEAEAVPGGSAGMAGLSDDELITAMDSRNPEIQGAARAEFYARQRGPAPAAEPPEPGSDIGVEQEAAAGEGPAAGSGSAVDDLPQRRRAKLSETMEEYIAELKAAAEKDGMVLDEDGARHELATMRDWIQESRGIDKEQVGGGRQLLKDVAELGGLSLQKEAGASFARKKMGLTNVLEGEQEEWDAIRQLADHNGAIGGVRGVVRKGLGTRLGTQKRFGLSGDQLLTDLKAGGTGKYDHLETVSDLREAIYKAHKEWEKAGGQTIDEELLSTGPGQYILDKHARPAPGGKPPAGAPEDVVLPGTEDARKVGKADVTFKAPQQASGDDFNLGSEGPAPDAPASGELFDDRRLRGAAKVARDQGVSTQQIRDTVPAVDTGKAEGARAAHVPLIDTNRIVQTIKDKIAAGWTDEQLREWAMVKNDKVTPTHPKHVNEFRTIFRALGRPGVLLGLGGGAVAGSALRDALMQQLGSGKEQEP